MHPSPDGADVATPVSIMEWMLNFYKQCRKGELRPLEGTLRAGECLFVPRGWWHLALNLEVLPASFGRFLHLSAARNSKHVSLNLELLPFLFGPFFFHIFTRDCRHMSLNLELLPANFGFSMWPPHVPLRSASVAPLIAYFLPLL